MQDARRSIPSVDRLLNSVPGRALASEFPRDLAVAAVREALDEARAFARQGLAAPQPLTIVDRARERLGRILGGSLRPVINATGVILHTNLGRAPLSAAAMAAMERVARGYSSLEYDLAKGGRGSRHEHVTPLLHHLSGAEAALVVNNNASAVLLTLATLASGKEVVISRGQLVEIGGGFRIPDVLRQSGATLVEVGTTNRTYAQDYADGITDNTALFLRVHASNFRVVGFVHAASLEELVDLAHPRDLLVVDDLGSGSLIPTERFGLAHEPMVQESVRAGADIVCFSGDKLLGGPQCGIIVGRAALIARIRQHPLTRAVRPDKATLAGLCATLEHYARGEAESQLPVWRMIKAPANELARRGERILAASSSPAHLVQSQSAVGGGSTPGETLPSMAIALRSELGSPQDVAASLRGWRTPIIGRVTDDRLLLDLRTIAPEEDGEVSAALAVLRQPG